MTNGRRWPVWAAVIALAVAALAGCGDDGDDADEGQGGGVELKISEAGGQSGKAMHTAFLDPYEEESGNKVVRTPASDLGKLQAAAKSGVQQNDLVELDSISATAAFALGLTQKIDYQAVGGASLEPIGRKPFGVGWQVYSTIPVWRSGVKPLSSVRDFFDAERFPGPRAVPDFVSFTLPLAVLADGVPPEDLYPLDVDRAFEVMDRIKGEITTFWESGAQPAQLLKSGEADYALAWSGRVVEDPELEWTFDGGLLDVSYLTIPKGAPHPKEIPAQLRVFTQPDNQLEALKTIPYAGTARGVADEIPEDLAPLVPSSKQNRPLQALQDPAWWAENFEAVAKRWEEWKLQN
jgi:putative spermidine/putrescine transport system substrate-binding protein